MNAPRFPVTRSGFSAALLGLPATLLGLPAALLELPAALLGLLLLLLAAAAPAGARPAAQSPQDLLEAVNRLRQVNGLPAYRSDPALMQAAQAQAEWQAAQGTVTHSGAGGTRPKERAAAAGYGGGSAFFLSENIAGGYQMSVEEVIGMWQGDDPHLNTMLGAQYRDAGAGVAISGDTVYYVLLAGYVADGQAAPPPEPSVTPLPGGAESPPGIQTSTPRPDGSVVHIVQPGETLWSIAVAYKISIAQLMTQNGLPANAVLYPGNRLVIRRAGETTPQPTDTPAPPTPTPTPAGPRLPTATPAWMGAPGTVVITLPPAATPAPPGRPSAGNGAGRGGLALGIGIAALLGIAALEAARRRGA